MVWHGYANVSLKISNFLKDPSSETFGRQDHIVNKPYYLAGGTDSFG
jgi:hypothetical protein